MPPWFRRLFWPALLATAAGCGESLLVGPACRPSACDDGNPCTEDRCDAVGGCSHTSRAEDSPCGAGRCEGLSWFRPTCQGGKCADRLLWACDDADPCTVDACDGATGCLWTPAKEGTPCGARGCNGLRWEQPACSSGECLPALVQDCDDGDLCTGDQCIETSGCTNEPLPEGADCGFASCGGRCRDGICAAATAGGCDDLNACTFDVCLPDDACQNASVPPGLNILRNPGFDADLSEWVWCASGVCNSTAGGAVTVTHLVGASATSLRLVVDAVATPMQLYQAQLLLEPNSKYRIFITARSPDSAAIVAQVIEHTSPSSLYGPAFGDAQIELTTAWNTFEVVFATGDFLCERNARLRILLRAPQVGDTYVFDHIALVRE